MNPSPSLYRALPVFDTKSGQGAVHRGEKDAGARLLGKRVSQKRHGSIFKNEKPVPPSSH